MATQATSRKCEKWRTSYFGQCYKDKPGLYFATEVTDPLMKKSKDPFSIKIALRHPSYKPTDIAKALSLKPEYSYAVGQKFLKSSAKWTRFCACLQKGNYVSEYGRALTKVVLFLEKNSAFWTEFMGGNGEVELILNHEISPQWEEGDKCFDLYLAPALLAHISTRGIGLRAQGWFKSKKSSPSRRRNSP